MFIDFSHTYCKEELWYKPLARYGNLMVGRSLFGPRLRFLNMNHRDNTHAHTYKHRVALSLNEKGRKKNMSYCASFNYNPQKIYFCYSPAENHREL